MIDYVDPLYNRRSGIIDGNTVHIGVGELELRDTSYSIALQPVLYGV